jgi:hypothetical protein
MSDVTCAEQIGNIKEHKANTRKEAAMNHHFMKPQIFTASAMIIPPSPVAQGSAVARFASSLAEVVSLAMFIAMIWVWAALASAPGV